MRVYSILFIVLVLHGSVNTSDICLTFDFEGGLDGFFTNDAGICVGMDMWVERNYTSVPVESPHESSTRHIAPTSGLSCMNSFAFEMGPTGVIEVNVYMESSNFMDQVMILAHEIVVGGNDGTVGNTILTPSSPGFVNGWHVLRIPTSSSGLFTGYVSTIEK